MYLRNHIWQYDFVMQGERYRGSTGFRENEKKKAKAYVDELKVSLREKKSVVQLYEQQKRKLADLENVPLTENDIWKRFVELSDTRASAHRLGIYRMRLRRFLSWMGEHHSSVTGTQGVTELMAREYMGEVRSGKRSPATCNDTLLALSFIFRSLVKHGVVENPFGDIKAMDNEPVSREAFTTEELKLIGENAEGWIYSLCLTALSTGLREGDVCLLKKESVNLRDNWITVKTRKTGATVDIPIMPGLRRHLEERIYGAPDDSPYVYPELADMYQHTSFEISHGIKEFFDKIGIQGTRAQADGYARQVSVKDVHSFRHTFVYLAAVHGIPLPIVQGIVGHASAEMTKHYMDHASRLDKRRYMEQLPSYLTGGDTARPAGEDEGERLLRLAESITAETWERDRGELLSGLRRLLEDRNQNSAY